MYLYINLCILLKFVVLLGTPVAARANYVCTSYSTFIASEFLRRELFIHSLKTNKVKHGPISSHITTQFPKKNVHSHLSIYSKLLKYTYYLTININQINQISNLKSQSKSQSFPQNKRLKIPPKRPRQPSPTIHQFPPFDPIMRRAMRSIHDNFSLRPLKRPTRSSDRYAGIADISHGSSQVIPCDGAFFDGSAFGGPETREDADAFGGCWDDDWWWGRGSVDDGGWCYCWFFGSW